MSELLTALGLVFVLEGLVYALAPRFLKEMSRLIETMPEDKMRIGGLWAVGGGVLLVWVARSYLA